MAILDTHLRVQHPCPYCDFSGEHPETEIALWCGTWSDVFQVTAREPAHLRAVLREMRERFRTRDVAADGRSAIAMTRETRWDDPPAVTRIADACGVVVLPPIVYLGGWETYRVVSTGSAPLRRFLARVLRIGKVELLSNRHREGLDAFRDLGTVPVHLFEGLTDRQVHALVSAVEGGLFDVPATGELAGVARREGLSRSTFGEHLRKAQTRIVRNSYPLLKLRDGGADDGGRTPARRRAGLGKG